MNDDEQSDFTAFEGPNDSFVVRAQGRLTTSSAPALRDALAEQVRRGRARLVLDLTDVESIDSAVLGAMISGVKLARQAGGDLRVVGSSGHVAEVLRLTQLDRVLKTFSVVDEAFADD
ncbi:MAG: anti-sigma factor antagonist [Mycobacterium sp.]|nr:MAG: anti-sigma factor antagonist [Mycobacterium sp.]